MLKVFMGVARINFLTLTLVCVALAAALSWYEQQQLSFISVVLVATLALAAHVSVNAFNEYFDFKSGLDFLTEKTPFSGGSGTLVHKPEKAGYTLAIALLSLLIVIAIGLSLVVQQGWQLLLIGVPGVIIIYTYTQYLNRSPLFCLLAPGVGFGLLMTLGSSWVFTGFLTPAAWVLAGIVTLLVSNLLLLNQFPDVEADKKVGRRHYPIVIGRAASARIFVAFVTLSYLLLVLAYLLNWLPLQALLGLFSLLLAVPLMKKVVKEADDITELIPALGMNIALCHLYPLAIMAGLFWTV
ncbi:prenyltransferase [Marinospirillum insulare]|uniref:1,4-dihydroxy-2-naphthoate octaprenyltransferase n=1 Tax=Marinospirillum insulare TaxID=217169 RepID=A0ABQ5ZV83_9GAMM|nr:prenyltransferase [Marinospirillum insulare]GLR63332.1 hypothetical protein GCM10007878_07670 [Marinospirillum insulare]